MKARQRDQNRTMQWQRMMANAYGVSISQLNNSNCQSTTNMVSADEYGGQALQSSGMGFPIDGNNSFSQVTHACKVDVPPGGKGERKMKKVGLGDKFISLSKIYNQPSQGSGGQIMKSDDRV